jgi:DNA-binding CsgD family transcriptional regulator
MSSPAIPEIAQAIDRLRSGMPSAVIVALDAETRSAPAIDASVDCATAAGFVVVRLPATEADQVSTRCRLLEALAQPDTAVSAVQQSQPPRTGTEPASPHPMTGPVADHAAELLDGLSRSAPIVAVIEDLRWTDPPSLQALRSLPELLAHLPICWVVGVGEGSRRGDRVLSVLRRLKTYAVSSQIHPRDRIGPSTPLAFLQVAAVIGVEFDIDIVARVLEQTVGSLLAEVEHAVTTGVLVDTGNRLRFTNVSVRHDLYLGLSPTVRKALHYDVAREMLRPGSEPEAVWHLIRSSGRLSQTELQVIRDTIGRLSPVAPEDAAELALQVSELFDHHDPHRIEFITSAAKDLGNTNRVGEALALVEHHNTVGLSDSEEGRLRLVAAHLHQAAGDDAEAMDHVAHALALRAIEPDLRIALLKTQAVGHVNLGQVDEATRLSEELSASIEMSHDPAVRLSANLFRSQLAFSKGQVRTALELAELASHSIEVTAARPLPAPRIPELWLATVMLSSDRAGEAAELLLTGQRQAERRGFVWSVPYWHTVRAIERWLVDELDDAAAEAETAIHAAETLEIARYVPMTRAVLAIVETDRGHLSRARRLLADATLPARARTYDIWTAAAWIRLGGKDESLARGWLNQHVNTARVMTLPPRLWPSLVAPRSAGWPVTAALSQISEAGGDQAVIRRAIASALSTGHPGDKTRRPARTSASASGWDSLTASELRVAALVVAGHTNKSIAGQLQVSVHTVSTHLRHVFTKLDINTRVELTRLAMQRSAQGDGTLTDEFTDLTS